MPSCGRFISEDPIGLGGGQSNLYQYAGADPLNTTDPSGKFGLIGAGIGALGNLGWQLYQNGGNFGCVNLAEVASWGLAGSGAGIIGGAIARGGAGVVGRFFFDPRAFRTISGEYWGARGGAQGMSLDHWMIGQAAGRTAGVPSGVSNAGWNLLELPMGLNRWLGFAPNWGGTQAALANAARTGIQVGVPAAAAGAGYAGYELGNAAQGQGGGSCSQ